MQHRLRLLFVPLASAALALTACGSDDASTDAGVKSDSNFNDADGVFAQGMIPHHEQAVEMAGIALAPAAAASPEIVELATAIQGAQDPEIVLMRSLLESWGQPTEMPGMADMEGMSSDEMAGMDHGGMEGMMSGEEMAALGTLTGAEFDQAWAEMMIRHHEGAIVMAETVLASGTNLDVELLADQIVAAQQAEIDEMRALLAG
ncbi:MAG TPA: DUF305 domain-containing protein [Ilumatobacteraceae bacterium]|nr:DUF305 domain-containing protein [Ilumatobacteraceae bacterium]